MLDHNWPSIQFNAMGGTFKIWIDLSDGITATCALMRARLIVRHVEWALSRFDRLSELSRLNRKSGEWISVSPLLWNVLKLALSYAYRTNGIFDPTIAPALKQAGYDRSFDRLVPHHNALHHNKIGHTGGYQQVDMFEENRLVYLPDGVELDLGGITKGYTVRKIADLLGQLGPTLVDGSGDITAIGSPHGLPGWPVGVSAPHGWQDETIGFIWLKDTSLATSGIDHRRWGTDQHHIIDPSTGKPARSKAITTTVLTSDMVDADVFATVALIDPTHPLLDKASMLSIYDSGSIELNAVMKEQFSTYLTQLPINERIAS